MTARTYTRVASCGCVLREHVRGHRDPKMRARGWEETTVLAVEQVSPSCPTRGHHTEPRR